MKTGPGDEAERAALEQAGAGDVDGSRSGVPWTRAVVEAERAGDRAGEQRLAGARDVLEEDVAVGQEGDDDEAERLLGPDDGQPDRLAQVVPQPVGRDSDLGSGVAASPAAAGDGRGDPWPSAHRRQAAQDRRQDPALAVVLDLDRAVEPGDRLEPALACRRSSARRDDRHRLARGESVREAADRERLAARSGRATRRSRRAGTGAAGRPSRRGSSGGSARSSRR